MRRMGARFGCVLVVVAAAVAVLSGPASAAPVKPLDLADCGDVRKVLEDGLPFIPGFRMVEFDLPKNAAQVEGKVCRLLTAGTGVHMETAEVHSLDDMGRLIAGALTAAGWEENDATKKFADTSKDGRMLFAVARKDAMCVISVVVGLIDGVAPDPQAVKDGKVHLGALMPYQREWWLALDCFKL